MQHEQPQPQDEPTRAEAEVASAVDRQAATSSGKAAEQEPEVPAGASEAIRRAEEHIDKLDMDEEREAAERTQNNL